MKILIIFLAMLIFGNSSDNFSMGYRDNNNKIETEENNKKSDNLNGNINNGGYVLQAEENIYISVNDEVKQEGDRVEFRNLLCKYSKGNQMKIINEGCWGNLYVYNKRLFFNSKNEGIVSTDFEGKNMKIYYDKICPFQIKDDVLYFADDVICSLDLKTNEINKLNTKDMPDYMNLSDGKIYYLAPVTRDNAQMDDSPWKVEGNIYSVDLDGNNNKKISDQIVTDLILDENYLYYIETSSLTLKRMDIDTNEIKTISTKPYVDININNGEIVGATNSTIDILSMEGEVINSVELDNLRDANINLTVNYIFYKSFGSDRISILDRNTLQSKGWLSGNGASQDEKTEQHVSDRLSAGSRFRPGERTDPGHVPGH